MKKYIDGAAANIQRLLSELRAPVRTDRKIPLIAENHTGGVLDFEMAGE